MGGACGRAYAIDDGIRILLVASERGGDGGVRWRWVAMAMGMMWGWKWWRGDDRCGFGGGVAATMRLLSGRNLVGGGAGYEMRGWRVLEEGNNDDQDSDEKGEEFIHPRLSIHDEEETRDEENFDPIPKHLNT
nr:hypothetical protein [Tanacetum cinerariifolium]